jgi:hypothetical protein
LLVSLKNLVVGKHFLQSEACKSKHETGVKMKVRFYRNKKSKMLEITELYTTLKSPEIVNFP